MFPNFQSLSTRFGSELLLCGGRYLSLFASKEDRGGIELASQQKLNGPVFRTRVKNHDRARSRFVVTTDDNIGD